MMQRDIVLDFSVIGEEARANYEKGSAKRVFLKRSYHLPFDT